jgi:rod shape-determining protein MreD
MKYIQALLLLVVVAFHEAIFRNATDILGVGIDLPAMFVVVVALHHTELDAIWFAFVVGVVAGAVLPVSMGWQALTLVLLAVGAHHGRDRLNLDSPLARLMLIIGGVLVHSIVMIFVVQPADIVYQIWRFALPSTLYSAIVASAYYVLRQSASTGRKIRVV